MAYLTFPPIKRKNYGVNNSLLNRWHANGTHSVIVYPDAIFGKVTSLSGLKVNAIK